MLAQYLYIVVHWCKTVNLLELSICCNQLLCVMFHGLLLPSKECTSTTVAVYSQLACVFGSCMAQSRKLLVQQCSIFCYVTGNIIYKQMLLLVSCFGSFLFLQLFATSYQLLVHGSCQLANTGSICASEHLFCKKNLLVFLLLRLVFLLLSGTSNFIASSKACCLFSYTCRLQFALASMIVRADSTKMFLLRSIIFTC